MKIAIPAPGSRGDVQPYVALSKGLLKVGHKPRILTNQNHESLVKKSGVEFWPLESNSEDMVRSEKMRAAMESGSSLRALSQMGKELREHGVMLATRSLEFCNEADLILGGISGAFIGHSLADKLDIPFMQVYNIPFTPTKEFPGGLFPRFRGGNLLSHHLTRQMVWQAYRPSDGVIRKEILGISKNPRTGPYKSESFNRNPVIYGFSPSVIPKPSDWSENIHVTGYWFLDSEDDLSPASEITEFLEAGSTPLYIGFGSMGNRSPEHTTKVVLKALKETNQRAILHTGWGGMSELDVPESILMVKSSPHAWLFPLVKAVIHHGGAGTTAAGLRSGVPSIVIPYHGDQPFWGHVIAKLGVGPNPIPHKKLTSERLAEAIRDVTTNNDMKRNALELGKKIQSEDGITAAISIINQIEI